MKARRKILSDRRGDKMKEVRISGTFKAVILAGGSGERIYFTNSLQTFYRGLTTASAKNG